MVALILSDLRLELKKCARAEKAAFLERYFHSDKKNSKKSFLGISVPNSRLIARQFVDLDFNDVQILLESEIHEERLIAIFILVLKYQRAEKKTREQIIRFYLKHIKYINDWDLVDSSADRMLGDSLLDKTDRSVLITLANSKNWWERRIAIMATFQFIKVKKESKLTFEIANILLNDEHDLIHKAVGWMLKEVGKKVSKQSEEIFLKKHYQKMPRVMLRYAIEKFPPEERIAYLKGQI